MAKSTNARPKYGQRSANVCISSSCQSSSSDDGNDCDFANGVTDKFSRINSKDGRAIGSWSSRKSRVSSSEAGDSSSYRITNHFADAKLNVGLSNHRDSIKSKRKWEDDDEELNSSRKGPKCFSRNAVMARLNRIKKKRYLETLENDVSKLSEENKTLKGTLKDHTETVRSLKNRVRYLESVLANSQEISMLLKNIEVSTGLPTINSLQRCSKLSPLKEQLKTGPQGFPPPQLDHMYSKTPDVSIHEDTQSVAEEHSFVTNSIVVEEDCQMSLLANDVTLPFVSLDDNLLDMNLLSPNSDDMFNADFSDFNQHFEDDDRLLSDVGICLHIAKKRVSLEFCASCNNNAVTAWDKESIFG